jgi:hypothetical protein
MQVRLDWPQSTRQTFWEPERAAPDAVHNTTSWDLRAMDVRVVGAQQSVVYPETTILMVRFPPPWM